MNYLAVLAKWWCMKKRLTPHRTDLSQRQANEKNYKGILS